MVESEKIYDLAIVGCGPAGLSAAVNARARKLDFVLLGSEFCSPKLYKAKEVNNYLGFHGVSGNQLRTEFLDHVEELGIRLRRAKIDNVYAQGEYYTLISRDKTFNAYTVILAVGVSNTRYLPGEERLLGSGVSYCATCDGMLYRGKKVAVIAYTDEGLEEAEYLSELAETVYFIPQFELEEKLDQPNIKIIYDQVEAVIGEQLVEGIKFDNGRIDVDGVFIFRETTPPDKLLFGLDLDGSHIKTNEDMETNFPGVYAAGDCTGTPYQLGRAVGQGQIASLKAAAFIRQVKKELKEKEKETIKSET